MPNPDGRAAPAPLPSNGPDIRIFIPVALPLPHVTHAGNVWKSSGEDSVAEGVNFALESADKSDSFKGKIETSNP